MKELKICHLYPDVLNLYGDSGNVICMKNRLIWRNIGCTVTGLSMGQNDNLAAYDLFFIGGGQDFEQTLLFEDLNHGRGQNIRSALEDGKTFLCVCGGYQLMGNYYETAQGEKCKCLEAVDLYTKAGTGRLIGNYAFALEESSGGSMVIGFENHGGRTYLGPGVFPLGRVLTGHGNNGADKTEGVRDRNLFGTYSHGPVLPKNPAFCDEILSCALRQKYGSADLIPLDDHLENFARAQICSRMHLTL